MSSLGSVPITEQSGSNVIAVLASTSLRFHDEDSEPFWTGLNNEEIRVQRCAQCSHLRWPARSHCNRCWSEEAEWIMLSGRGRIHSWAVNHHVVLPSLADLVPFVILHVSMEEQDDLIMPGVLAEPGPVSLSVGMPLRAVFNSVVEGQRFLSWTVDGGGGLKE
jgi:hypothetical protein